MQYQFDDGSMIGQDASGEVYSREIGSSVWVNDAAPAPAGWNVFSNDIQEQNRLGPGYPANGQPWDANAATLGVTRLIDTAVRAYATVKGSTPATFAGQNGQTYVNGQTRRPAAAPAQQNSLPLLLVVGAAFLLLA